MLSRKGAVLVVGGSVLLTLGFLVVAVMWVTSLLTGKGGLFMYISAHLQTDQGPLALWIEQHAVALSSLASQAGWLGTGGAFFLGLAALGPGLNSLLEARASAPGRLYRWLAILGLLCTLLTALGRVTLALSDQELGIPLPDGLLLMLLKMPFLWIGLIGFSGVLWGSFLVKKPANSAVGQTP
jgi:hypothetical protein